MKALLWKDYRLNRLVLAFGLFLFAAPYLVGIMRNIYLQSSGVAVWTPSSWQVAGFISLGLSLFTFAMLGATSIAVERNDRSAEFLAYLPVSRWQNIASKSIIAISPSLLIWAINLLVILALAWWASDPDLAGYSVELYKIWDALYFLAGFSVVLFGASWFFSSMMEGHAISMGLGIGVFVLISSIMATLDSMLDIPDFVARFMPPTNLVLGALLYFAGCVYYLRRVEP